MEKIQVNSSVLEQIFNDKLAFEELESYLNGVIDTELCKPDSEMDCDLIDECIQALEEISLHDSSKAPTLVRIMSRDDFLKSVQKQSVIRYDGYKRLAAVCASAVLLVAASNIKTKSGETVAKNVANKIAYALTGGSFDLEDEPTTAKPTQASPEVTEQPEQQEPVTEAVKANKPKRVSLNESNEAPVVLEGIALGNTSALKTEYKLGEELDTSGLNVISILSDGTQNQVPVSQCTVSVPREFYHDAGKYTVTVLYEDKSLTYTVTVNAVKQSVVLNSIYGTFSDDFSFKIPSFDEADFSTMTVTAVYSDGSEKVIPKEEYKLTVEENFMELENKALVTVEYEGRSFSFILTEEAVNND